MSKISDKIKKATKGTKEEDYSNRKHVSTGVTQLNLASSGKSGGGIPEGIYVLAVGDSSAGKTVWMLTTMAEMANDPNFDDYEIVGDLPENGVQMSLKKFFGKKLVERFRPPQGTQKNPKYSSTLEEFYDNLDRMFENGKPFFYGLDSIDALTSEDEEAAVVENRKEREKGRKGKGSFQTSRPKINSTRLRVIANKLKKHKSFLVILSQARQNIGYDAMFNPKTRAGGTALKYYCRLEYWFSIKGVIKKKVHGVDRKIGQFTQVAVKKNHITGWEGKISFPIFRSHGVDDLMSCIDYLILEKYWKGTKKRVSAPEFDYKGSKDGLIAKIEEEGLERELQILVAKCWKNIEEELTVDRKRRYE